MKKIIGVLRPFDRRQNFYVYEDGNKIDKISVTLDEMDESLFALAQKHDIMRIDLSGPKQYARGLAERLKEDEIKKYNRAFLEINIV